MAIGGSPNELAKNIVSQLRVVQLSLLAVSIGLIITVQADPFEDIDRAYSDIRKIVQLSETWEETWSDYVDEEISVESVAGTIPQVIDLPPIEYRNPVAQGEVLLRLFTSGSSFVGVIESEEREEFFQADEQLFISLMLPDTLTDFEETWDLLSNDVVILYPVEPDPVIRVVVEEGDADVEPRTFAWESLAPKEANPPDILGLFRRSKERWGVFMSLRRLEECLKQSGPRSGGWVFCGRTHFNGLPLTSAPKPRGAPDLIFVLPVEIVEQVASNAQLWLARFHNQDWVPGPFERSFPELAEITKNYRAVSLDDAQYILESERARSGESVSLLGVAFPRGLATTLGPLVLIGLQLYFLLHCSRLVSLDVEVSQTGVAWAAIYPGKTAGFFASLSVLVLPIATLAWVTREGYWFLFVPITVFLSLRNGQALHRLREESHSE